MTDQTNAELCLAVARAMGKQAELCADDESEDRTCGVLTWEPSPPPLRSMRDVWVEFRPDRNPAQFAEVTMWVRGAGRSVLLVDAKDRGNEGQKRCVLGASSVWDSSIGIGPTDAIALLRAVAALGEVG